MKYIAIIDEEMLSNFRIDEPLIDMPVNDKILVVTDKMGLTRGIQLKPFPKEHGRLIDADSLIKAIKSLEMWNKFSDEIEELLDKRYCEVEGKAQDNLAEGFLQSEKAIKRRIKEIKKEI